MAKIFLGNVRVAGPQGEPGNDGIRGSLWFTGTAITGTSLDPVIFADSGIEEALFLDCYVNTDTNDIYQCLTGGDASTATWAWVGNLVGAPVLLTATLATGETEITFTDARITDDSILSFYTSIYAVNPTSVTEGDGYVTLIFDAQETDMEVGVRIDG